MMIARLNQLPKGAFDNSSATPSVARVLVRRPAEREIAEEYDEVGNNEEPFPDHSTLEPLDCSQEKVVDAGIAKMLSEIGENSLPPERKANSVGFSRIALMFLALRSLPGRRRSSRYAFS